MSVCVAGLVVQRTSKDRHDEAKKKGRGRREVGDEDGSKPASFVLACGNTTPRHHRQNDDKRVDDV